jgi:hypothetical protein
MVTLQKGLVNYYLAIKEVMLDSERSVEEASQSQEVF